MALDSALEGQKEESLSFSPDRPSQPPRKCMHANKKRNRYTLFALGQCLLLAMGTGQTLAAGPTTPPTAADRQPLSLSGDIGVGVGYDNIASDLGYGIDGRVQLKLHPTRALAVTTRIDASRSFNTDVEDRDTFMVDRCYVSWDEEGLGPFGLAAGRLPTLGETSPGHLRQGLDRPEGTLSSFADMALDGLLVEYRHQRPFAGQVRLYFATQTDDGYESHENPSQLTDTTIYGVQWELRFNPSRSLQVQSLLATDLYNLPEDKNPLEFVLWQFDGALYAPQPGLANLMLDRQKLGDLYQSSLTYLDKVRSVNYFLNLGWSHTNPSSVDELGTSLLGSWWDEPENRDGYAIHAGVRYDMEQLHSAFGLEYNHGSRYWVGLAHGTANHKLATRGSVSEAYWTVKPPLPAALAGNNRSLIGRIGYQYYDFDYTGSGSVLGEPLDIDDLQNDPLAAQFYDTTEFAYTLYASLKLYF